MTLIKIISPFCTFSMIPWQQNNATWENNFVGSVVATKRVTAPSVSSIQGQVGLYNVSEGSLPPRVVSILRLAFRPSLSLSWAPVTGTMEPEDVSPMPLESVLSEQIPGGRYLFRSQHLSNLEAFDLFHLGASRRATQIAE